MRTLRDAHDGNNEAESAAVSVPCEGVLVVVRSTGRDRQLTAASASAFSTCLMTTSAPLKYQRASVEDSDLPPSDGEGGGFHEARLRPPPFASPLSFSFFPLPWLRSVSSSVNRYYVVLFFAILAISCSGTLLRYLPNTPPLLKAFWRLLFMSGVLSVGSVVSSLPGPPSAHPTLHSGRASAVSPPLVSCTSTRMLTLR